jgi:genome maintenance exonuclease 1
MATSAGTIPINATFNGAQLEKDVLSALNRIQSKSTLNLNTRNFTQPLGKITGLAGRVDCIAEYKKEPSIIDFKASTYPKKKSDIENYFCQAAAYSLLWQERTQEQIPNIVILIANEQGFCQVYKEKVINFIEPLKKYIDTYKKEVNFDGIIF